jgi:hypothetical protein
MQERSGVKERDTMCAHDGSKMCAREEDALSGTGEKDAKLDRGCALKEMSETERERRTENREEYRKSGKKQNIQEISGTQ